MTSSGQRLNMYKYDSLPNVAAAEEEEEEQRVSSHINVTTRPYSRPLNDDDDDDTDCLIHSCKRFSTPVTFLSLIVPLYTVFIATGTYFGGCISTIEKQFQLSSSQSGFIATINDIVSLCLVVFATYYGSKSHRPRILCIGGIIVGIGFFLLSLPHFTSDPIIYNNHLVLYNDSDGTGYIDTDNELCSIGDVVHDRCAAAGGDSNREGQPLGVLWLVIGQILIGIGGAPLFPLTITYLDDSTVDSTTTSIYIAAIFMAMAFGPFIGFITSFKCLSLYVDFHRVDEQIIPTNPRDPRWIGAWWLGFVIASALIVMLSIPFFFFPRKLRKYECTCCKRRSKDGESSRDQFSIADVYKADFMQDSEKGIKVNIKGLMNAMKRIVSNPTVVFLKLSSACDLAIMGGFAFFIAKYVEKQFAVSAATASIILGGINLPGSVCGNIMSSFCVKKFKLNQFGMSRMLAIFATSAFLFAIPLLFIGCSNPAIAGVTTFYNASHNQGSLPNVNNTCNSNCACSESVYRPVCGSDGITYTSACHAGCTGIGVWSEEMKDDLDVDEISNNDTIFVGCSCISTGDAWETTDGLIEGGTATEGSCDWSCDKLLPFVFIVAVIAVFASMKANPSLMLSLRCVDSDDRALTVAFGAVIVRVLGFFPAPIYFGAAIASTCLVRQESCSRGGACLVYDLERYRYSFIGLFVGLKLLAVVLAFCVYGSINPDRLEKNKSNPLELVRKDIVRQRSYQEEFYP